VTGHRTPRGGSSARNRLAAEIRRVLLGHTVAVVCYDCR
jgi:hypothetical protein